MLYFFLHELFSFVAKLYSLQQVSLLYCSGSLETASFNFSRLSSRNLIRGCIGSDSVLKLLEEARIKASSALSLQVGEILGDKTDPIAFSRAVSLCPWGHLHQGFAE